MNLIPSALETSTSEPVHLLIVDDVRENLVAMEALLRRDGLTILCASSGQEALELLLEHDMALALLDVHMPEMDGFTLAELMRGSARTRQVPIIFLTASPSDPRRSFKGYETGAVDFLHKPIEPHVILGKVNVFIELYQQRGQLAKRNAALERALELNETMMAVLTHDLRTPLSVILLSGEKLRFELRENESAQRTLGFIENSGRRMARMVEQLLDFSRIRTGGLRMRFSRCDLGELAHAAIEECRQAHCDAGIELVCHGDLTMEADPDRFAQIMSNLIGNAALHGQGSEIQVTLDGTNPRIIRLQVANGGEIPEELLPRLFEPFKSKFKAGTGLGLGLYIAHQFVASHGGTLEARNEQGRVIMDASMARTHG